MSHLTLCRKCHSIFGYSEAEKTALRQLFRFMWTNQQESTIFYTRNAASLIERMEAAGVDWAEISGHNKAAIILVELGEFQVASRLYHEFVYRLVAKYWEDCPDAHYQTFRCSLLCSQQTHCMPPST